MRLGNGFRLSRNISEIVGASEIFGEAQHLLLWLHKKAKVENSSTAHAKWPDLLSNLRMTICIASVPLQWESIMFPTLIVPTRNRPQKLAGLLNYLADFYPQTRVIVADGSDAAAQEEVANICASSALGANLLFRPYPADLPLFDRMVDLVLSCDDHVLALSADDDYPIMDTFALAAKRLEADAGLSCVIPYSVLLTETAGSELKARLSFSHFIEASTAAGRLEAFAKFPFATSYGAVRRETLLARYRSLGQGYCAGFVDFQIGAEDCFSGRIAAMSELGSLRTHSYRGSYLRPSDPLIFLRRGADILGIIERLSLRLAEVDQIGIDAAKTSVQAAISHRISQLVGARPGRRAGFTQTPPFSSAPLQNQFAQFYDLFRDGTQMRQTYGGALRYVGNLLLSKQWETVQESVGDRETV